MFKASNELHEQLVEKKAGLFDNRDNVDRELIEKMINEAYADAEKRVNINTEWEFDKSAIPTIFFEIDHYISNVIQKELEAAGWEVSCKNNTTLVRSK